MREKRFYVVLSFASTTDAMAFEASCQQEGIPGRMIPTPREISASCGLSWRMAAEDYPSYSEILKNKNFIWEQENYLFL